VEKTPTPAEVVRSAERTAFHLEMRDGYMRSDPWFQAWLAGRVDEFEAVKVRPWMDLIREVTGRRVEVRRVRIVSEPVSDYARFEYDTTNSNIPTFFLTGNSGRCRVLAPRGAGCGFQTSVGFVAWLDWPPSAPRRLGR
jgi:hypothetical protein